MMTHSMTMICVWQETQANAYIPAFFIRQGGEIRFNKREIIPQHIRKGKHLRHQTKDLGSKEVPAIDGWKQRMTKPHTRLMGESKMPNKCITYADYLLFLFFFFFFDWISSPSALETQTSDSSRLGRKIEHRTLGSKPKPYASDPTPGWLICLYVIYWNFRSSKTCILEVVKNQENKCEDPKWLSNNLLFDGKTNT